MTLSDLERLARAATPGPWRNAKEWAESRSAFEHVYAGMPDGPGQTVAQWVLPPDAAHIAACSPERILALLAHVRELEDGLRETLAMAASPYIQTPPPSRFTNDTLAPTDRFTALRSLLAKGRGACPTGHATSTN